MCRYVRPISSDVRDLLRQAADCCAATCLRALEPESRQRTVPAETRHSAEHAPGDHGTLPHSCGPEESLQEAKLRQLLDRLIDGQQRLFRGLAFSMDRSRAGPRAEGYKLMAFLATEFVPAACRRGFWALAADEVAGFLHALNDAPGRERECLLLEYKYLTLLAVPSLWMLIGAHPILEENPGCRVSRAERLQQAWATCALFNALQQLHELPSSVRLAAGVLAAICGPAGAAKWIESARQTAELQGARAFTQFFGRIARSLA